MSTDDPRAFEAGAAAAPKGTGSRIVALITVLFSLAAIGAVLWFAVSGNGTPGGQTGTSPNTPFPVGTESISQPSGLAPPSANALPGYTRSYVTNFVGATLPAGWYSFTGQPGGDPGALFATSHVVVGGGVLHINTFEDPAFNGEVVTGGLCQCGHAQKYGAFFVRSRITGPGPNDAELLWPKVGWPPEIDFNENGGVATGTSATLHYTATNQMSQNFIKLNLMEWHTWGVIWTPASITLVVDGHEWGKYTVPSEIPRVPMTLDFEQRTACSRHSECPSGLESMVVDWVEEYTPK